MAAEAVGIAQRALELGVEYAKTREQFGKPIGVYQAVSHQLADTYTDVELARSLAYWAAWCVAEDDEQAPVGGGRGEGVRDRGGRRRLRAVDPGARRHRIHVGSTRCTACTSVRCGSRVLASRPSELRAEVAEALLGVAVPA